jgi:hypothetical protein
LSTFYQSRNEQLEYVSDVICATRWPLENLPLPDAIPILVETPKQQKTVAATKVPWWGIASFAALAYVEIQDLLHPSSPELYWMKLFRVIGIAWTLFVLYIAVDSRVRSQNE